MAMLREKGIAISDDIDGPLRPGSVVFLETPEGVTHRDLRDPRLDRASHQGRADQDGGNAGADAGGGGPGRFCNREPVNGALARRRIKSTSHHSSESQRCCVGYNRYCGSFGIFSVKPLKHFRRSSSSLKAAQSFTPLTAGAFGFGFGGNTPS